MVAPLTVKEREEAAALAAANDRMNLLDSVLVNLGTPDITTIHQFTPGLYTRQVLMPKGTLLTTKIHKTEHPFVVTQGVCTVWNDGVMETIVAPHFGVTKPGTRRAIYIHEDTVWTTFHATDKTTPEEVEKEVIFKHEPDPDLVKEFLKALPVQEDLT